jgi:hypothetical protein
MVTITSRLLFEVVVFVLGVLAIYVGAATQEFLSFLIGSVAVVAITSVWSLGIGR